MEPREHHFFFAKQMIPTHTFQSPDKMFAELTGPQREAFLMYLWREAGKGIADQVPHADVGRRPGGTTQEVVKLDVVGAIRQADLEVVVISMPPALASNEAIFLALARGRGTTRVFTYERCAGEGGAVSETDAVLAEITPTGRSNFGFFPGDGLEGFKEQLGRVLGISLAGLETSLPPVTMEAFLGAGGPAPGGGPPPGPQAWGGQAPQAQGWGGQPQQPQGWGGQPQQGWGGPGAPAWGGQPPPGGQGGELGGILEKMLLVRAGMPVFFWLTGFLFGGFGIISKFLSPLATLAVVVVLLIWIHGIFTSHSGKTTYSPGFAVGAWFIPLGNAILPPLVMRDAWKAVRGPEGSSIVFLWWLLWLTETALRILFTIGFGAFSMPGSREGSLFFAGSVVPIDATVASILSFVIPFISMVVTAATYGLLWLVVRRINEKA